MLSFEISAVDLALFIAIIILFILYLRSSPNFDWLNKEKRTKRFKTGSERTQERDQEERHVSFETVNEKTQERDQEERHVSFETVNEKTQERNEFMDTEKRGLVVPLISGRCPYNFGYLRKLSDEASIPSECLECSRILECRYEIISDSE
jgi:hypothetical protein